MKTVLLVDDSRAIRLAGRRILESLGMQALEAGDGREALEVVHEHPDVGAILLDWNMPVMNGLEFLVALRSGSGNQPPVVMCTTESDLSRITTALAAGANEYIMKPFTDDILSDKLREIGVL